MLAKKNRIYSAVIVFLTLNFFIAGCTPPGPRALIKGQKLLERGNYEAAVEQLKTATSLLPTNAQAWNYLGVACQRAGQADDAVTAYQRALRLDRDLMEAHYNLGLLWLEENKPADAKTEFTAYTLRRSNEPEGWLKLGSAQLRANEPLSAEKSFSTALYLSTNNAEALNGLGLARIQRGRSREAAQFFEAAVQHHPDYAPALLNLATVAQQDLHDNQLALENYRAYLALDPRPANWDEVKAIADSLEGSTPIAAASPSAPSRPAPATPAPAAPVVETKRPVVTHSVSSPKPVISTPRTAPAPAPHSTPPLAPQMVNVSPEPTIVTTPVRASSESTKTTGPTVSTNPTAGSGSPRGTGYFETGVTPLPPSGSGQASSTPLLPPGAAKPIRIVQPAPPTYPRYLYLSPRTPPAGDHVAASGAFTRAQVFEQSRHWTDAMEWYRRATEADPGWFEAQYNYGALAYRLRNYNVALATYETALAIQPGSTDARYNFALALKGAGYAVDAVNEFKKILVTNPDDVRAHLALGNLYAQQFFDPAQARQHYLKVLELDPHNPQATDLRFWLSANPP